VWGTKGLDIGVYRKADKPEALARGKKKRAGPILIKAPFGSKSRQRNGCSGYRGSVT